MRMTEEESPADGPPPYLFQVVEGPTYNPEDFLLPTLRLLSRRFAGEMWSYGSYEADIQVERMRLRVVKDTTGNRIGNYLRFSRQVMRRARELRASTPQRLVVTSYDPFKGGLLAWRVARLLRGTFVCEVNGQYGDPDNFAHVGSALWKWVRLLQMRVMGSFVLHRADGVRLLFAEQLANFAVVRPHTVVRHFFALSFTDRFQPGPEERIILCAGFPFERKGVDTLVSAFTRVADKYPQWRLVLIGHRLPEQLCERGLEHPQVDALPGMPQEQLAQWMSRCAIFALPSRSEAMGRVLIEAAAAEKSRIATRVGGIPTVVEQGYDGLLVPKGDVEQLATGLAALMGDDALRHRLGRAAKKRTESEFSGESYLKLFEELIAASLAASGGNVPPRIVVS
jgi:glycosyltransferase involved in cell wall biosynthesis